MITLATVLLNSLAFAQIAANWSGLSYNTTGTLNGAPTMISQSSTTSLDITMQTGDGSFRNFSGLSKVFWFYGSGEGNLEVSIPYSLTVRCEGIAGARAKVALNIGPGTVSSADRDLREIHCISGETSVEGVLFASRTLVNPFSGPLVTMHLSTETEGFAVVPEKRAAILVLTGIILVAIWFLIKGGR